jgi:GH24 family phage-related lysozyme (muramidase)
MKPQVAVDITARDKTDAGFAKAEARADKYGKHLARTGDKAGLGKLGEAIRGLSKIARLEFNGEGVAKLGAMSRAANENVGGLTRGVLSLGVSGPGAFGAIAEGAGLAAGAVAGATAAVIGLGVATYSLGDKWAHTGGEIGRTSKTLDVATGWLQATRAANERFGVTTDQTTASVDAFASTLYDAKYGANNLALGALTQLGVKMKTTKAGNLDVAASFDEVTDAIARQTDPLAQRKLAQVFGLQAMLPAIRQGGAKLAAARADYLGSGAALSPDQVAAAEDTEVKTVRLRQHLGALEKKAGMAAMGVTALAADKGVGALHTVEDAPAKALSSIEAGAGKLWDSAKSIEHGAQSLTHSGLEAGRHLVEGGERAAAKMIAGFEGFIDHAKWDRNAYRAGYGSDTVTDAATGQVSRVTPGTKVSRDAALFDLTRRVRSEFMPKVARSVGSEWGAFDDETKAALTSVAYNYGHLPRNVLAAARSGDPGAIAAAIRAHEADNGGINARRRAAEADAVAGAAKAHVTVDFKNLPAGAAVRADTDPGVSIDLGVHRALQGAP